MQTVRLSPQDNEISTAEIEAGRFATAEQTIEAALQLLKQHQAQKLAHLREVAREAFAAFDRGEGVEIDDIDAFVSDAVAEIRGRRTASAA